jgi:branched-subunit amino acid aminotransferase/4-amino-4-deoxychorismate lyase
MTWLTNSRLAWFNGKFMPENQVLIPFRDRSWRYGDGAFDMTRTFNGRAFRLKEHIDRFYCSLRYLRLDPGMSPQEMIDVSEQIVVRNEHLRGAAGDWWIGQRVSRGVDPIVDEVPEHSGPNATGTTCCCGCDSVHQKIRPAQKPPAARWQISSARLPPHLRVKDRSRLFPDTRPRPNFPAD